MAPVVCGLILAGCQTPVTESACKSKPAAAAPRERVALVPAEQAGWELVFSDDFKRAELGDNWQVVEGNWEIDDNTLFGSGTLLSAKGFSDGFIRMEFSAATDVRPIMLLPGGPPPTISVCDTSSIIHAQPAGAGTSGVAPTRSGYFFQFGGFMNTQNRIRKMGQELVAERDPAIVIVPDQVQHVVVENDNGNLRMFVDGELALATNDPAPLSGEGQDRVGFYFYTAVRVHDIKVYQKR